MRDRGDPATEGPQSQDATAAHAELGSAGGMRPAGTSKPVLARTLLMWLGVPLTFGLALLGSWNRPPWTDEAYTLWVARLDVESVVALLRSGDVGNALYYSIVDAWMSTFGSSLLSGRILSVIAMTVAAAGVILLGRELASPSVGLAAGVAFALLPVVWDYAMEARSYALATAAVTWSSVVLVRAISTRRRVPWALYAGLVTMSGYVFFFAVLVFVAHGVSLALVRPPTWVWWRWLISGSAACALMLPLVVLAATQPQYSYDPTSFEIIASIAVFWTKTLTPSLLATAFLAVAAWLVVAVGLMTWHRSRHERDTSLQAQGLEIPVFALPWLLTPAILLLLVSVVYPVFELRYIVPSAPAFALLIGFSVVIAQPRWLVSVGLASLAVGLVPAFVVTIASDGKDSWGVKRDVLTQNARPGDGLVAEPQYYYRMALADPIEGLEVVQEGIETPGARQDESLLQSERAEVVSRLRELERVWLVRFREDSTVNDSSIHAILVEAGLRKEGSVEGGNSAIDLYVRAPE